MLLGTMWLAALPVEELVVPEPVVDPEGLVLLGAVLPVLDGVVDPVEEAPVGAPDPLKAAEEEKRS